MHETESQSPNPYAASGAETESDGFHASPRWTRHVLWTVPGGGAGALFASLLMGNYRILADSFTQQPIVSIVLLLFWGVCGLLWTLFWRLPRAWVWGRFSAPAHIRFLSGLMLTASCVGVMLLGKEGIIRLPEPTMSILMFSMLFACAVATVEFEHYFGRE